MKPDFSRQPQPPRPQRKVFDVMRPGRAPASSTSKPVIVGHKPLVRDPAVTMAAPARRPLMNAGRKVTVRPTAPVATPATPTPPVSAAQPGSPALPPATDLAAPPLTPSPAPASTAPAVTPAPAAPAPKPAEPAHEDALLDDLPAPVFEDHDVVSRKVGHGDFPWKTTALILVIIALALFLVNVLLDADFLSWDLPHTDFL